MTSIWIANYENNTIKVENTWFKGERLYVNDDLQDDTKSLMSAVLTGHLVNSKGERENIKVNLGGFTKVSCKLFINDKLVEVTQEK